ncbi:unnamed protein product [Meganyctiphanes norvegica]|uniref:Carbohydrate sulfotransferase n=1 Tax=Meganyctiphanes norvegica TaxID=48144 RepID=A0AAV2PKQ3_MEGNR
MMKVGMAKSVLGTSGVLALCYIALVNYGVQMRDQVKLPLLPYHVLSAEHPPMCNVDHKDNRARMDGELNEGKTIWFNLHAYPCKKYHKVNRRKKDWPIAIEPSRGRLLNNVDVNKFDKKIQALVSAQLQVQNERTARLADTCEENSEYIKREHTHLVWGLRWDPPIIYCPIFKAASTTWTANFLRLAHVNENHTVINSLTNVTEEEREKMRYSADFGGGHLRVVKEYPIPKESLKKKIMKKSISFLVVRHPFTRFLSAYRDKIERHDSAPYRPYFNHLGQYIIHKYRPRDALITQTTPTFSEFVDYVIDFTKNLTTVEDWETEVVCWMPFWVQCKVCTNDYQVVIKLETMDVDEQFLAQIAGLKEIQNVHQWFNSKEKTSSDVVPEYFSTLTKKQVQKLYSVYKMDFDMFGYDIEEFMKYAKN